MSAASMDPFDEIFHQLDDGDPLIKAMKEFHATPINVSNDIQGSMMEPTQDSGGGIDCPIEEPLIPDTVALKLKPGEALVFSEPTTSFVARLDDGKLMGAHVDSMMQTDGHGDAWLHVQLEETETLIRFSDLDALFGIFVDELPECERDDGKA